MKRLTLTIFTILVASFNLLAQQMNVFNVKYKLHVSEESSDTESSIPFMEVFTHKDYALVKAEMIMGSYDYLVHKSDDSVYTLINHEEKNYYQAINSSIVLESMEIDYSSNKTKTIQGYTCHLARVKYTSSEDGEQDLGMEIWYTKDIPNFDISSLVFLKKIPGIALEMATEYYTIEAYDINKITLPQSTFEIPEDFEILEASATAEASFNEIGDNRFYYEDETGALYGLQDGDGNILTPAIYTAIMAYIGNVSIVTNEENKYGAIDYDGNEIIPLIYDYLSYDAQLDQYVFSENEKFGIMQNGKVIIPAQYELLSYMANGVAIFHDNGKDGLINEHNKIIVPAKYSNIIQCSSELFINQEKNGQLSLYRISDGKQIASKYDTIMLNEDAELILVWKDNKYGFINKQGKIVLPLEYVYATEFVDGVSLVSYDENLEEMFYIDTTGKKVEEAEIIQ